MKLLAIDPGSTHSAYVVIDTTDPTPLWFDKLQNEELLTLPHLYTCDRIAIENIGHYGTGMPAGQTVFDTCVWIGRFLQAASDHRVTPGPHQKVHLIPRREVKLHLCGSAKANDGNVRQALIDRFAPDQPNSGKGRKNQPGFFYGFHSDVWQAFALAVYFMDTHPTPEWLQAYREDLGAAVGVTVHQRHRVEPGWVDGAWDEADEAAAKAEYDDPARPP